MEKRGQIWVETVIYTLIAFIMIGLVLTFAIPKIQEIRDEILIEQSIEILDDINEVVREVEVPGNIRIVELNLKKGTLNIDGENDLIYFEIESAKQYSEYGANISQGNIIINTESFNSISLVTLTSNYTGSYDITFDGADELKTISEASTIYNLKISNKGGDLINLDFTLN
jgi:hypothetical protein